MANIISPFGALDFMHQGGSQRTEELQVRWIASSDVTPIFYGDIVQLATPVSTGTTLTFPTFGPFITQGGSATPAFTTYYCGVFRGCEFYNTTIQRMQYSRYWPGATIAGTSSQTGDVKAFLNSDLQARFIIQGSSLAGVFGSSLVGSNFNVAINGTANAVSSAGGNYNTGNSGMQLSSQPTVNSSQNTVNPWRLIDFYSNWAPGNFSQLPSGVSGFINGTDNTTAGQILIVQPNNNAWAGA